MVEAAAGSARAAFCGRNHSTTGANHVDAGANRVDFTLVAITFDRNDAEMGALRVGLDPKRDQCALAGAPFSVRSGAITNISIARDANDADRAPLTMTVDVNRAGVDAIRADSVATHVERGRGGDARVVWVAVAVAVDGGVGVGVAAVLNVVAISSAAGARRASPARQAPRRAPLERHRARPALEPSFRAGRSRTRKTGGLGLGLTLARRIVHAHGGSLQLSSGVGSGTVARIALPPCATAPA